MAEKPASERTEKPTPRRMSKARSRGHTPHSEELASFFSIAVLVAMLAYMGDGLMRWFFEQTRDGLSCDTSVFANNGAFIHYVNTKIVEMTVAILPTLAALCVGGIIAGILVSGVNLAPGAIQFKLDAVNPMTGFASLFDMRSLVRLGACVLKLLFVGLIAWYYLHDKFEALARLRWTWSIEMLAAMGQVLYGLMIRICLALLVISIGDVAFQKWKYIKDLMMTKQEVKEEQRQAEGPPEIKSRIRKIQYQTALRRMMREVPKASVVLVNPTHVAVAIRYDAKTMEAPILAAKGVDYLAEKIREIARAYGVPILRRPELARTIYATVKVDSPIPEALYVAVAEVLALIHRLRQRRPA
jgi:flagellar biosynthetic protein FlhB